MKDSMDAWIGRGSFGVVKLQIYRGVEVAVKELLSKTLLADVQHEAKIIMKLCHPNLPFLFGICTKSPSYKLVFQFHGLNGCSVTLANAIVENKYVTNRENCLLICVQVMEALRYLHDDAGVLHKDLKCNNILLAEQGNHDINVVIIDFGKATYALDHKKLRLSGIEQAEYAKKCPHAPEVVEGKQSFTFRSDIYSAGGILFQMGDKKLFSSLASTQQHAISTLAEICRSSQYYKRPSAIKVLTKLQDL